MRVAFVLSGGSSLGASQAGMLQALYERDIRPEFLVGTSVGAINAAFIASRPQTVETAVTLQEIWRRLNRGDVFPANPVRAGLGFLGLRDHAVSVGALRRLIERHVQFELLKEAPIELHVVASDAITGDEVLLSAGSAVQAVLASAAVPGVFPPVSWGSKLLVDGGVANNTPISHAIELGADRVIVLQAFGSEPLRRAPRGALAAGLIAAARVLTRRLADDIVRYADEAELIVLAASQLGGILPTDFGHADELIDRALKRTRALLAQRGRVVPLTRAA